MTLSHIRYLGTDITVCERPDLLGTAFVAVDSYIDAHCKACLPLAQSYNRLEDELDKIERKAAQDFGLEDPLQTARALVVSMLIGLGVIAVAILLLAWQKG